MKTPEQFPQTGNSESPDGYTVLSPEKAIVGKEVVSDFKAVIDPEIGTIIKAGGTNDVNEWLAAEGKRGKHISRTEEGGNVIAGLTDAHEHPILYGSLELLKAISLADCKTKEEVLDRIRTASKEIEGDKPLVAIGMDNSKVRDLVGADIDRVFGGREVVVLDRSFHGGVVSQSMAREIERLAQTRDFAGYLKKDGSVSEEYGLSALEIAQARFSVDQVSEVVENKLDGYLRQGITSVHDMIIQTPLELEAALILRKKWKDERGIEFPITKFHLRPEMIEHLGKNMDELQKLKLISWEEMPDLIGMKLLADGSFGSYTAKMGEPFLGGKGRGLWFDNIEKINKALQIAREHGITNVAMHAIGDEGIRRALETARKWQDIAARGASSPSFRIEHFSLPLPMQQTIAEARNMGVWVVPQPNFLLDFVYKDRLGERVKWICPHGEMVNQGVPMMLGTDGMPDSMLYAIYAATHAGEEHQRLSLPEALFASTVATGRFEGTNRGMLSEGQQADIIVADPTLINQLAAGDPDIGWNPAKIAELEGSIRSVYKTGVQVYGRT